MNRPVLFATPHRLLFLVGVMQLFGGMGWWSLTLMASGEYTADVIGVIPASLLHAPILLYLAVSPFFLGFLLTVFPRWIGFSDAGKGVYLPVGLAYFVSAVLLWISLFIASSTGLALAFFAAFMGQIWAVTHMARWLIVELRQGKAPSWHGWSALAALGFGMIFLLMTISGIFWADGLPIRQASRLALLLYIVPVFVTVAHRMVPFFAGNVVEGYVRWRPFWVLGAYWTASMAAGLAMFAGSSIVQTVAHIALAGLTGLMAWKWWPRASAPGLLWVLILGFAWAPLGFALDAFSDVTGGSVNLAGTHALTIGFVCSLVIAMVTRVSQGHSGRPLMMPIWSWVAFAGVQIAALLRLATIVMPQHAGLLVVSAAVLTFTLAPWAVRGMALYIRRRADGKPG